MRLGYKQKQSEPLGQKILKAHMTLIAYRYVGEDFLRLRSP